MFIRLIKVIIRSIMVYFKLGYIYHKLLDSIKKRTDDVDKSYRQKLKTALLHSTVTYRYNPSKVVKHLIDRGFNVNAQNSFGTTPLMLAARRMDVKTIDILLKNNADIFLTDSSGSHLVSCISRWQNATPTKIIDPCFKAIVAHLAVLVTLDDTVLTVRTRNDIESNMLFRDYFVLCTKQLEEMKNVEVSGRVTLFKLLTESENKVAGYARNGEFKEAFDDAMEKICCLEFYYVNTLRRRIAKAMDKIELERKAALTIETLCGLGNDAHHVVVYKIIGYLRRRDLQNLCNIDLIVK